MTINSFLNSALGRGQLLPRYGGGKPSYSKSQVAVIQQVYDTLSKAGFDNVSIAGILGNALQESTLNWNSVNGQYKGLFQNEAGKRRQMQQLYKGTGPKEQLQYLIDWVNKHEKLKPYTDYLTTGWGEYKKAGYKSPEDAAYDFVRLYERAYVPGHPGVYQDQAKRMRYAKELYDYLNDTYGSGVVETAPQPSTQIKQPVSNQAYYVRKSNPEIPRGTIDNSTRQAKKPFILQKPKSSVWTRKGKLIDTNEYTTVPTMNWNTGQITPLVANPVQVWRNTWGGQ